MSDDDQTYTIIAKRMAVGEPVGEGYLYGREACEMISRRLVSQDVMTAYRSGAFLARRELYGQPAAVEWERNAKANHELARAIHADMNANPERTRRTYAPRPSPLYTPSADIRVTQPKAPPHWTDAIPAGMEHDADAIRRAKINAGVADA
jgi:hypothetical protein